MLKRILSAVLAAALSSAEDDAGSSASPGPAHSRRLVSVLAACALLGGTVFFLARPGDADRGPVYHSPLSLALSADGTTLYATDRTADSLAIIDAAKGTVKKSVSIPEPTGLALSPDGSAVYVASASADRVYEVDTEKMKVRGSLAVGRAPAGIAVSPDGKTIYCCNQFSDDVSVIDEYAMEETQRIKVKREPRFAALAPGRNLLVVPDHLPLGSNLDETLGAEVSLIDLADGSITSVQLSRGATDVGQVCCSPDGKWAYIVHVLARWLVPPTQLDRGWVATNALTVIDLEARKRVNTVLLDDLDRGAANPCGAALSSDGATLYVTHSGVNEVQIIDTATLHKLLVDRADDTNIELENDLTAVYRSGARKRVPSGGIGPRGIVAADGQAYVANYYSGTVTSIRADGKLEQTIALGKQPEMNQERRGEMLFNDAIICFQGWQSCATCHPDGRTDGLSWDLLNDGIGNPKNAKSMLLSGPTPPVMSSGVRDSMQVAVMSGLKYILFHVPTADEIADISAYLDAMRPARSPLRNPDGSLSEAAKRGKAVFERDDVACARCHPGPLFTDLKGYDVGTRHEYDDRDDFDTPTLVEMFRSAPYLHDGSAITMREVLVEHNKGDLHGRTTQLSERELNDLAEYLLSL